MSLPVVSIAETKGALVRPCPGTRHHICCGYTTIDVVEGCVLSCSYCVLKDYLNTPGILVHGDMPYILQQVQEAMEGCNGHIPRFGTGELSDSLALDRKLRLNEHLITFFGEKKRGLLELKSKWASIDHLRPFLNPYTVISFSLAPPRIISEEEKRTSPLHKRLKTLRQAQDLGCFVGLHFDPIIIYPGFEKDYEYLIGDVGRILDLSRVIWVSMGLLRFMAKSMARFLGEGSKNLLAGEFTRGEDGKYRYIKAERVRVYRMIHDLLKEQEEELFVYLCMERSDVWEQVTGRRLVTNEELIRLFDTRIQQFYGGVL